MNAPLETFTLNLGNGVRFTARVNIAAVRDSEAPAEAVAFEMEGPRTAQDWPKYLAWAKSVWQHVADASDKSIASLFAPPHGKPFAVVFEPKLPSQTHPLP